MQMLNVEKIHRRSDARELDAAAVAALAESIAEVGLMSPIRCRIDGDGWEVIAGSHRLAACESLGLTEIEAVVVEADDLHAELAMIDENLCRAELSPSDRARQTARRKAIYEEMHPETVHGANQHSSTRQVGDSSDRFTADTAASTGRSERAIQRDAERGAKVIPEVLDMIRGTKLDTGAYLDKIKGFTPNDQFTVAKRDLALLRQQVKPVKIADAPLDDGLAEERQVAALMSAWNKASASARQEFLNRIDTPVFDASRLAS